MGVRTGEPEDSETAVVRYKPESLETLRSLTRFSAQELKAIYRGFKQVRVQCRRPARLPVRSDHSTADQ